MSQRPELTPPQAKMLNALVQWISSYSYPPSVRELGSMVGLSSTNSVSYQLAALEEKGYIERIPGGPRMLRIVPPPASDPAEVEASIRVAWAKTLTALTDRLAGAIADPGSIVGRQHHLDEPVASWSARAVTHVLAEDDVRDQFATALKAAP